MTLAAVNQNHTERQRANDAAPTARTAPSQAPVVISFCCGDSYYFDAAARLREDCRSLGVDCDIVELSLASGQTWIDICRKKIPFYLDMLRKHDRPLLWMDVDCRLLKRPDFFDGTGYDVAAFLRGFKYIRAFDSQASARFFQPSILLFNNTRKTKAFLEFMCHMEQESKLSATDDFFLQEAWTRFDQQLSLLLLPPDSVSFEWPAKAGSTFYFGSSGNVSLYKQHAVQHEPELFSPTRRKAVLLHEARKTRNPRQQLGLLRAAFDLDPKSEETAYRVARALRRAGRLSQALVFLRRFQGKSFDVNHARRFLADSELDAGNLDRAEAVVLDLLSQGTDSDRAWAQSRLMRIGLEKRARELSLTAAERPALWWMETPYPGNFGDILNPYVVEKLSGRPPRFVPRGKGILAIGSVVKFANENTVVWGSGTPRMSDRLNPKATYTAVRGPLTRKLVIESGGTCPEVYGDPAWFLPRLYTPASTKKTHKLGLILHHANAGDLEADEGVKMIPVLCNGYEGIEAFIDEVNRCEYILSTSLHGLIVCHAYGIPAAWCEVPDGEAKLPGDGTKFHDHMLSVGLEPEAPTQLPKGSCITLADASRKFHLPRRQIDLDALAEAAPFEISRAWRQ